MCGICGMAAADPAQLVDEATLRRMADVIEYRGPDDSGMHVAGPVGLAMRRLSIIDLERGRQPIRNEDRTVHLVFNGEIYNYRELRRRLASLGHEFSTNSDTEVVVHAYEEWGTACLDSLRGMFAFGLWDDRTEKLLLAVDRFGIKPLYYGLIGDDVVFGSELACLLASGRLKKEVDHGALAEYFTLGYIPPPATIFGGASKLEPGTFAEWTPRGGLTIRRYWDVPAAQSTRAPRTGRVSRFAASCANFSATQSRVI
jgi:asparagine synthase (glutamine-hydrolysing)